MIAAKCGLDAETVSCNDMEMYYQCERAQKMFDKDFPVPVEIQCMDYIACAAELPGDGKYWCQNVDSYRQCIIAKNIFSLNNISYSFQCTKSVLLVDGRPVLNYKTPYRYIAAPTPAPPPTPPVPPPEGPPDPLYQILTKSSATTLYVPVITIVILSLI